MEKVVLDERNVSICNKIYLFYEFLKARETEMDENTTTDG
jgi:hypothetical protein